MGTHSWSTSLFPLSGLIEGHHIGIVANQTPVIFTNESKKAVQFIRLCNQASIPILFMHNVTGFMVGKKTEREGLVKSGSLFVDAVSRSQVPHLSIVCGASYGAGNYAVPNSKPHANGKMCGRAYDPRFLFSWPVSRCSVMGPDQLTGVMTQVALQAAQAYSVTVGSRLILAGREGHWTKRLWKLWKHVPRDLERMCTCRVRRITRVHMFLTME